MRLIDADALIKEYPQASGLKLVIENAPTAYDVEKVVKELLTERKPVLAEKTTFLGISQLTTVGHQVDITKAIDIVKKGGKNDD